MIYRVQTSQKPNYKATVDWVIAGERKRKYFRTLETAKRWANERNIEAKNSGLNALTFPEADRVEAIQAKALLAPFGKSLLDAVQLATSHWNAATKSIFVKDAVDKFLAEDTGRSVRYQQDLRCRLGKFKEAFGERLFATLTVAQLREWFRTLKGLNERPISTTSRNNIRRIVSVLFAYAVECGWVGLD